MNDKSVVLSISILISGREEMRKCLDSLSPLMEKVSCELILVDTGCNEEQLAIARECIWMTTSGLKILRRLWTFS